MFGRVGQSSHGEPSPVQNTRQVYDALFAKLTTFDVND